MPETFTVPTLYLIIGGAIFAALVILVLVLLLLLVLARTRRRPGVESSEDIGGDNHPTNTGGVVVTIHQAGTRKAGDRKAS